MGSIEGALTNAVTPAIIVFFFIGYLSKRDANLYQVLKDLSDSNIQLKEVIEQMYSEMVRKNDIINEFNKRKVSKK